MKSLLIFISLSLMSTTLIFDFSKTADVSQWTIVDDVVMGGRSSGNFALSPEGYGVFSGEVSLENNGGFSSVRYQFDAMQVGEGNCVILKLKGDGKDYQFRVKHKTSDAYSYITTFSTNGEWQEIEIPLEKLEPSFRGRKLNRPNFAHNTMEEIVFLIGNKKPQEFKLLLDRIALKK